MKTLAALVLLLLPVVAADRLEVALVDNSVLEARLAKGVTAQGEREASIAGLFQAAGCEVELQKVIRKADNVICTLAGSDPSASQIIVGGHYDFAQKGEGIIDDWSGASMLVSLYDALKASPRRHAFKFVAFAKEEAGLVGSRKFVHDMADVQSIRAFINLECLGTSPTKAWTSRANKDLLARLSRVSATLRIRVEGMNADQVGDDDSHPFLNAGVPVLTLHSLDNQTIRWIHSSHDRLEAIRMDDYSTSYRIIAVFLAYLDSTML